MRRASTALWVRPIRRASSRQEACQAVCLFGRIGAAFGFGIRQWRNAECARVVPLRERCDGADELPHVRSLPSSNSCSAVHALGKTRGVGGIPRILRVAAPQCEYGPAGRRSPCLCTAQEGRHSRAPVRRRSNDPAILFLGRSSAAVRCQADAASVPSQQHLDEPARPAGEHRVGTRQAPQFGFVQEPFFRDGPNVLCMHSLAQDSRKELD